MEKVLKLYKYIDGINDNPFPSEKEQVIVADFRYNAKRMGGAPTIDFTSMHRLCLDSLWSDKVYASFNGERYFVKQTPTSSYSSSDTRYKHEVELVSERFVLDNVYFYDTVTENETIDKPVSNSSKFSFYGDVREYVSRLDKSIERSKIGYSVVLDDGIESEELLVSFENQVITSALQEIYNVYNIPYYFVGKVIHVGYYNKEIENVFKYGFDNSLISISKQNANSKIINRITGVGSADNIPYYYPNDDERGITRALLNGQPNMVEIVNLARYRKLRLADELKFYSSLQTLVPLINEDDLEISNIKHVGTDESDDLTKYIIKFYYSFSLSSPENVRFKVETTHEDTEILRYEIIRDNSQRFGYFNDEQTIHLTNGSYNLIVTWTFYTDDAMLELDDYTKEFINLNIDPSAEVVVEANESWTLNGLPVQLSSYGLSVNSQYDGDVITFERVSYIQPQHNLMPPIYRNTNGDERFYESKNNTYINSETGEYYVFEKEYSHTQPREHIEDFDDIKPTIKKVTNASGFRIDRFVDFAYDEQDSDETDENGNFYHPYFFAKLNKTNGSLGFNLFEHSIDESDMTIAMTSGSCGSCEFIIGVDEKTQKNTVQVDEYGNLLRDSKGNVRFGTPQDRQNDTENYEVWVALRKDLQTFGVLMPNATNRYRPSSGDTFVILHIELPRPYVDAAEKKLEDALLKYMHDNNAEKFNFSISFSRIFFSENPSILENLSENSKLKIEYDGRIYELYASSLSYSMSSDSSLPEVKIELNDSITISQNQINQVVSSAKKSILDSINKDVFWGDIKGIPSWITSEPPVLSLGGIDDGDSSTGFWKLMKTESGEKYLFTEMNVVTQMGLTSFASVENLNLPSIYNGLPIDNQTIYWEEVEGVKVLKSKGSGNGEGTIKDVTVNGNGNALTSVSLSGDKKSLVFTKDKTFAEKSYLDDNFAKKTYVDQTFVTLATSQTITGGKNFTGGLSVNGCELVYNSYYGYWKLTGDLLVTGGISTFSSDMSYTPSTIMDGVVCDNQTIKVENINGVKTLKVIGGTGGGGVDEQAVKQIIEKYNYLTLDKLPIATTSQKGIASFDSNSFSVASGHVSFTGAKIKVVTSTPSSYESNTLYVMI